MKKTILLSAWLLAASAAVSAAEFSVGTDDFGASGQVTGNTFNKDWPIARALAGGDPRRGGLMLNPPMTGALCEIFLIKPVDITAVGIIGLDYHGVRQVKSVDILLDGKVVRENVELPFAPGKEHRIALDGATARTVGIKVRDLHPVSQVKDRKTGQMKPGPNWGGFARLRVYSSTDLAEDMKVPAEYKVPAGNSALAFNAETAAPVKAYTRPRQTVGNPCTIWDQEDIDEIKSMMKKSPELQKQYAGLIAKMNALIQRPIDIPQGKKDEDGKYVHVSDRINGAKHNQLALDICDLGIAYVLSGDKKYADYAGKMLLAYAEAYKTYAPGARSGFNHDQGMLFDQRLSDATWLIQIVRGYDLIYNALAPEQRKTIEDGLIKADAKFIAGNRSVLMSPTNWSAISLCSILMAGYATHDEHLIDLGEKGWSNRGRRIGGYQLHFSDKCIDKDGLWAEGAMGYQFMAMQALVAMAETLLHHNIDMYAANNGAFKKLFDSAIRFAYADLTTPAIHDSGHGSILGYNSNVFEQGYKRYRDPNYLTLLKSVPLMLATRFQVFSNSCLWDLDRTGATPPLNVNSINFTGVGYGVTRLDSPKGQTYLLLDYGPNRSHGHPDKLNIDLFANSEQLVIDPGCIWYERPLYRRWYRTSVAHNTVVVDEKEQRACGAKCLVFAPAETLALQRAATAEPYPGVTMDRSLFLTPEYLLDIFGVFSRMTRKYDLLYHVRGDYELPAKFAPAKEKLTAEGYCELGDVRSRTGSDAQIFKFTSPLYRNTSRLISAPGKATEYITGTGHYGMERPLTVIERRNGKNEFFCNVLDYTGKDFVRGVSASGSPEQGFFAAAVHTEKGVDLGLMNFSGKAVKQDGVGTDALQAFVRTGENGEVYAAMLAGGSFLEVSGKGGNFRLASSPNGIAYVEKTSVGSYIVGNLSENPATVTLDAPWNRSLQAAELGLSGEIVKKLGPAGNTFKLPPAGRVELMPRGCGGFRAAKDAERRRLQAEAEAREKAEKDAALKRLAARKSESAKSPVRGFYVEIPAVDIVREGGGAINRLKGRIAAKNAEIAQGWNDMGHFLEYEVNVPSGGYYHLGMRYCTQMQAPSRIVSVNGENQEPTSPMTAENTGGWARSNDDWKTAFVTDAADGSKLLLKLKKGKNLIRLENQDGNGINVDYFIVCSPDRAPEK